MDYREGTQEGARIRRSQRKKKEDEGRERDDPQSHSFTDGGGLETQGSPS